MMCLLIFSNVHRFEGIDESLEAIPCSSKKLMDLDFNFKYNIDEYSVGFSFSFFAESIELTKEKGLTSQIHSDILAP